MAEVNKGLIAGQQADETSEELAGRRVVHGFLGQWDGDQLIEHAQGLGEMAPGNEERMLGRLLGGGDGGIGCGIM